MDRRPKILILIAALFTANLSVAQLLYTEDFESYNTGIFSTDHTGATPAQGGWYTFAGQGTNPLPPSVNHFEIVSEPNKGKVFKLVEETTVTVQQHLIHTSAYLERTDLNTYWQQRNPGNNVLKLAFDIYTEASSAHYQYLYVTLFNAKEEVLVNFWYVLTYDATQGHIPDHFSSIHVNKQRYSVPVGGPTSLGITLPAHTWVTVEMYIDYDNDRVYFSVPSLNHTVALNTSYPFFLTGGGENDDNPVKLWINNAFKAYRGDTIMGLKIDNINLSAQNFTPTVGVDDFISSKFNVFPNPATDVVTITNNENMGVEEVTVYDGVGRIVQSELHKTTSEMQLNIENLASGSYFLHIKTAQGTAVKKLIKK